MKSIITLLIILSTLHACQSISERSALGKKKSQQKETTNQETTK
jgi:hypothetical protein